MIRVIQGSGLVALLAFALCAGCQQQQARVQQDAGPALVPYTAVAVVAAKPAAAVVNPSASTQIVYASPAQDRHIMDDLATVYGRSEKFVLGNQPVYQVSAYSEYMVDAQPIGPSLGGGSSGYRYRYVSRGAVSFP